MKKGELKEIEVKARVINKKKLLNELEKLGVKLSKPITQKDKVFLPNGITYEDIRHGTVALRIRKQDKKMLFTLKQRQEVELSALERELEIGNSEQLEDIFKILGFYEWVNINKKRRKAKYKNYEICLDEVELAGTFIEIEKMADGDGNKIQEELFTFLETLGIKREDRERRGYDTIIHQLNKSVSK